MEGAKVYVQTAEGAWEKATVIAALGGGRYRVQPEPWEKAGDTPGAVEGSAGEPFEVDATKMEGGSLPFQNANMPANGFPNMTTLDHLHEAALLHNLRVRFLADACPYTYTADIVIAVNPYRWFPDLYSDEMRKEYLVFDRSKLAPHAYATSSAAYSGLQETKTDQAILVSGESGAGKTETVKILMGHLALIASSDDTSHVRRIVESNPLLESFGNAQTVRNDNSSRFGKFIELQLNDHCRLSGSKCRTYLLEKSRVVGQDAGERNYHIFYQMLAVDEETRASFGLGGAHDRSTMRYTRLGNSPVASIEGMADGDRFKHTVSALSLVGVEGESLSQLLRALAAVLLLGELEFNKTKSQDDVAAFAEGMGEKVAAIADVLKVEVGMLEHAMTKRTIKTRNESFVKPLLPDAALATRDALAKELYSRVFDWLVAMICAATSAVQSEAQYFVGLLDIFGFESFAINRFEQLCINYANEKLQQKFTLDVFKAVQQEYTEEGIPWEKIEFKDNAPVLSLIESKMGIIAMLNEEGVRPKGSDENFVSKLSTVHKADAAFSVPRIGKMKELQFSIKHYAGSVTYTTTGWLERNKDTISDDVVALMRSSGNPLVGQVFAESSNEGGSGTETKKAGSDTVATKFKSSLAQLMETIGKTNTQYVRCIKPNKIKSATEMDNMMVVEQLRCAGVIEAIQVSRAGFPARMPLVEFAKRFGILARAAAGLGFARGLASDDAGLVSAAKAAVQAVARGAGQVEVCRALMGALRPGDNDAYEIGRTRVYFKMGVLESLEERRALLLQSAATEITRRMRGLLVRRHYELTRRSALRIQSTRRMVHTRRSYRAKRAAAVRCQALRRGVLARRRAAALHRIRGATRLQAFARRRSAQRELQRARRAAVVLQSWARMRACRRQYLVNLVDFKEQAKLENQVRALKARLEAQETAMQRTVSAGTSSEPPAEILEALQALAAENAKLRIELEKRREEIQDLRRENQLLRAGQSTRNAWLTSMVRSSKHAAEEERRNPHERYEKRANSGLTSNPESSGDEAGESFAFPAIKGYEATHRGKDAPLRICAPLSHFWEDVPCSGLPLLKSGSEVHVKLGRHILAVEEKGRALAWKKNWMTGSHGYRRSMAFFIERRAERRTDSQRGSVSSSLDEEPLALGPGDDGCLGLAFALRSAMTMKYVLVGGLLDWYCMQVTGEKPEDAAVFTIVPMMENGSSGGGPGHGGHGAEEDSASEYSFALRLLGQNKMLSLRKDGYVSMVAVADTDADIENDKMAVSVEYLRPSASYEITVEEKQIGIAVGKDLPLRVVGFKPVLQANGSSQPGPAERTGRVRVGDFISSINGQDISGIPRRDVLEMIACRRPVTLGFTSRGPDGKECFSPCRRDSDFDMS